MSRWNEARIDLTNFEIFKNNFKKLGTYADEATRKYLKNQGSVIAKSEIVNIMPMHDINNPKNKNKNKHAKTSKSLQIEMLKEVGFKIKPEKAFNYLVFPNDALGRSIKNKPLEFFQQGLETKEKTILDGILDAVTKEIEREL